MLKRFLNFLGLGTAKQKLPPGYIDVRRLMEQYTVEEFNQAAEQDFRRKAGNAAFYLKKPFRQLEESGPQLVFFAEMLGGLKPMPDMRLLDFGAGAGACWTSRFFAELGVKVIACDASPSALDLGRQRFARNPPAEPTLKPEFLVFNGRRLDLPDESIDRIACFDALHHLPNPRAVLAEFARVLKPGGIAGFSEPGPRHSLKPESQFAMKSHRRVENDIILEELWPWAEEAGFADIRVAVCNPAPFTLGLKEFNALLGGGGPLKKYVEHVRRHAAERRLFFLRKGRISGTDSRPSLLCELGIELAAPRSRRGGWVEGRAVARNIGKGRWLPSDALFGPVKLGIHLKTQSGQPLDRDFARATLPGEQGVEPGEVVEFAFRFQAPAQAGDYLLQFDLVSEDVCWFEDNGAKTVVKPFHVE